MKTLLLAFLLTVQSPGPPPGYRPVGNQSTLEVCQRAAAIETWARRLDAAEADEPVPAPQRCAWFTSEGSGTLTAYIAPVREFSIGWRKFGIYRVILVLDQRTVRGYTYLPLGVTA